MEDDLLELAAITNLLLMLHEVQLAHEFARMPAGAEAFATFRSAIAERIQHRARPEPGRQVDESMLELQARMLTRWNRLATNVDSRRAELRTLLTSGRG
jgi:hypothetical protein